MADVGSEKGGENDANNTENPENELLKRWNETEAYTVRVPEKTTKRVENLSCNLEKGGSFVNESQLGIRREALEHWWIVASNG